MKKYSSNYTGLVRCGDRWNDYHIAQDTIGGGNNSDIHWFLERLVGTICVTIIKSRFGKDTYVSEFFELRMTWRKANSE